MAVFFNIPCANGQTSGQLFKDSAVYRFISQTGVGNAFRNIRHPGSGEFIRCDQALDAVERMPPDIQAQISAQRQSMDLELEDDEPINDSERAKYREIILRVCDPTQHADEFFHPQIH